MRKMKLLAILSIAAFAGMLVYGAFIQRVEVSSQELKGIELVSIAAADTLYRVDGRIVEKTADGESAPRCPT